MRHHSIEFDLLVVVGSDERQGLAPPSQISDGDFGESALQCVLQRMTNQGVVIASADDPKTMRTVLDSGVQTLTYAVRQSADVTAKIIEQSDGMTTLMMTHHDTTAVMETPLCGAAMAANHSAATLIGLLLARPLHEVVQKLERLRQVPGRGHQIVEFNTPTVILDACGTPARALNALRTYRSMKTRRLWCVIAIDPRDDSKDLARYGSAIERFADHGIVTCQSDWKSKFLHGAHCVLDGVKECASMRLVADSKRAVSWAIAESDPGDTVLVLGLSGGETAKQRRQAIKDWESYVSTKQCERIERDSMKEAVPQLKIADLDYES